MAHLLQNTHHKTREMNDIKAIQDDHSNSSLSDSTFSVKQENNSKISEIKNQKEKVFQKDQSKDENKSSQELTSSSLGSNSKTDSLISEVSLASSNEKNQNYDTILKSKTTKTAEDEKRAYPLTAEDTKTDICNILQFFMYIARPLVWVTFKFLPIDTSTIKQLKMKYSITSPLKNLDKDRAVEQDFKSVKESFDCCVDDFQKSLFKETDKNKKRLSLQVLEFYARRWRQQYLYTERQALIDDINVLKYINIAESYTSYRTSLHTIEKNLKADLRGNFKRSINLLLGNLSFMFVPQKYKSFNSSEKNSAVFVHLKELINLGDKLQEEYKKVKSYNVSRYYKIAGKKGYLLSTYQSIYEELERKKVK